MRNFRIEDTILYEDKEIVVCHKPAGMAVQNARCMRLDMESALKNYLAVKVPGKVPYLAVIHRLDQPVEGVLVFAKTPGAAKELSRQLSGGEMDKKYLAVTSQVPEKLRMKYMPKSAKNPADASENNISEDNVSKNNVSPNNIPALWNMEELTLRDYLKKDGKTNTSSVVPKGTQGGKEAKLAYRVLQEITDERAESGKRYLLEIQLDTGRHHQIRVQMAHAGMPLLGDRKYNSKEKTDLPLGLCSCVLSFVHPVKKKKMRFEIFPEGETFGGFVHEKSVKKFYE